MERYEIAFAGQLVPGAQPEAVRANLARLFQADAQRVDALFSGRRVVIKNDLEAAVAEKYRATLERAGAVVEVRAMAPVIEEIELAPPPGSPPDWQRQEARPAPAPVAPVANAARLQVAPRDDYMAAFAGVEAPDFGLAPVGADLQDAMPEVRPPSLDLSALSLAPVGSDMGEIRDERPPVRPDISHLRLAD